jgi:two-component system NarL family sensor kinase
MANLQKLHLCGRLLEMQDQERRRVAHELHNSTGQNIAALQMNLTLLAGSGQGLDARCRQALSESLALAQSCVIEVRRLSYSLHPPLLDELGLVAALRAHAAEYNRRTGVSLKLSLPARMRPLQPAAGIALFRIAEGGLLNIQRRSGSQTAVLRLKPEKDSLVLELIDRGNGISKKGSPAGLGIAIIRERVRQLGGQIEIKSSAGGTRLRVSVPRVRTDLLKTQPIKSAQA